MTFTENKKQAIQLYREGIFELEKGIAVNCSGHDGEKAWDQARRWQSKMKMNLKMATDRLNELGEY